jgi:hypothetical protein
VAALLGSIFLLFSLWMWLSGQFDGPGMVFPLLGVLLLGFPLWKSASIKTPLGEATFEMRKASGQEVEAELHAEVEELELEEAEPVPGPSAETTSESIQSVERPSRLRQLADFKSAVRDALLRGNGPFTSDDLSENVVVVNGFGLNIYDAVVKTADVHYLVEVKSYSRLSGLPNAVHQIERLVRTYGGYLRSQGIAAQVVPVIVVPACLSTGSLFQGIPILKFDPGTQSFTNEAAVKKVLEAMVG